MKSKGDFIEDLLNSKKLDSKNREKILTLSVRELERNNTNNQTINKIEELKHFFKEEHETLLEKIGDLLKQNKINVNQINLKKEVINSLLVNEKYPIIHSPDKTVFFLNYFTDNNMSLKYATHSWEEGKFKSYDDFMSKIKIEWDDIKSPLKKQSNRLYGKISNFLFNSSLGLKNSKGEIFSWGEKRLKFGWSSNAIKQHMLKDGNSPFSCEIPIEIRDLDKRYHLNYFENYAEAFKNEIECREDSKNLIKIITDLWGSELGFTDFNISGIDSLEGCSFFTDVQCLKEVIKKIFSKSFKNRQGFPEIIIDKTSNFENGGYHIIKITQKDSYSKRQIKDGKFWNPNGELFDIINSLKNIADYSIESKFGDYNYSRLNYLSSSKVSFVEEINDSPPIGFSHVFKFYLNEQNNFN
jgi:hypothetical protein